MSLQTPLTKVRRAGSVKEGAHHWWMQRLTALGLIALVLWLVFAISKYGSYSGGFAVMLASPVNAVAFILFACVALYHACLGLQVIVEDYVQCNYWKYGLIITVRFVSIVTVVSALLAGIYGHVVAKRHMYHHQVGSKSWQCKKSHYGKCLKRKHHGAEEQDAKENVNPQFGN